MCPVGFKCDFQKVHFVTGNRTESSLFVCLFQIELLAAEIYAPYLPLAAKICHFEFAYFQVFFCFTGVITLSKLFMWLFTHLLNGLFSNVCCDFKKGHAQDEFLKVDIVEMTSSLKRHNRRYINVLKNFPQQSKCALN